MLDPQTLKRVRQQLHLARAEREATIESIKAAAQCSRYEAVAFMMAAVGENWPDDKLDAQLIELAKAAAAK